jgi:hypothetical protein
LYIGVQNTSVYVCHDNNYLKFHFNMTDKNIISNYTKCNDDIWRNDAAELFITT